MQLTFRISRDGTHHLSSVKETVFSKPLPGCLGDDLLLGEGFLSPHLSLGRGPEQCEGDFGRDAERQCYNLGQTEGFLRSDALPKVLQGATKPDATG